MTENLNLVTAEESLPPNTNSNFPQRLYSLDALRGFDMFWIMGAEDIFHNLASATKSPFWEAVALQFTHPEWNGFTAYDLIFPLFLFLAGVSTPYSIGNSLEKGKSKKELLGRILKRGFILFLLGLVINNGLNLIHFEEIRFGSVLGRIGLAYVLANIIYLYMNFNSRIISFFVLLLGYWLILKFTSAPGFPTGDLTMEGNFASYVDRIFMPGRLYLKIHDPEGLFSTLPAVCTCLLGIFAGILLKNVRIGKNKKAIYLASAGIVSLVIAQIWGLNFPINKNLWTSSFVLQAGGLSLLLLSLFYYIIDVLGYQKWAFFFKVIGMNSIFVYMSGNFISFSYTNNALFKWLGDLAGDPFNAVILSTTYMIVKWLFFYFMYKKNIFLRV